MLPSAGLPGFRGETCAHSLYFCYPFFIYYVESSLKWILAATKHPVINTVFLKKKTQLINCTAVVICNINKQRYREKSQAVAEHRNTLAVEVTPLEARPNY